MVLQPPCLATAPLPCHSPSPLLLPLSRWRYYSDLLPLQNSPPPGAPEPPPLPTFALATFVARWCAAMLDGVRWTLRYYLEGVPSCEWYFPYPYPYPYP